MDRVPASTTSRVLVLAWAGLAALLIGWSLLDHPGLLRAAPPGARAVEILPAWAGGALLSLRVDWQGPRRAEAWVVLEPGSPWPGGAESFWRRRVYPGTNDLLWPVEHFPPGQPVRLRTAGAAPTAWSVAAPRVAHRYGATHLAPLRGLLLALALLIGVTLAALLARVRRGAWALPTPPTLALLIVAGVALVARLHTLTSQSLWFDEVLTAIGAQSLAWILYTPQIFGHPPLQYLLAWLAGVHPGGEAWLRAPFVVAGVASVVATGRLGTVLLGPRTGVLAALGLAISAVHVEVSQTARPYALLLLLTVLSLLALVEALRTDRPAAWLAWSAIVTLVLYTQYLGVQVLAIETLTVAGALVHRRGRGWPAPLLSLAGIGLLFSPWLATVIRVAGAQIGHGEAPAQHLLDLITHVITPLFLGQRYATPVALALLGCALLSLRRRPGLVLAGLLWVSLPALLLWVARPSHFLSARHLAFVLPILMLGVAQGVRAVADAVRQALMAWSPPMARRLAAVTAVVVTLVWASPAASSLRDYYFWRHGFDWRDVAQVLERTIPRDAVVFATTGAAYPLRHYWNSRVEVLDPLAFPEQLRTPTPGTPVWVVSHDGWDRPPQIADWLEHHAVRVGWVPWSWSLPGVSIYRLPG